MSKRTDNISRFISSTRNLALVQMFVGLAFLGAASVGTYYVHQELRADRLSNDTRADLPADEGVSQAEHDELLQRVNTDYELILKQNRIIKQQNEQITAGNAALNECRTAVANQSCPPQQACPEPVICPAPVNTRPLTDRIKVLESDLAACSGKSCPPPSEPCTYQGMPCLDAIAALEDALKNSGSQGKPCEINGVPCDKLIAEKDEQIASMKKDLAAATEARNDLKFQIPEELQKLDAEQLEELIKLLQLRER